MRQDQIVYGVTVRALVAFEDIPAGTLATIDQVCSDADEWRFSVVWQCFRTKSRSPCSLFFTAARSHSLSWRTLWPTVRGLRKSRRITDQSNSACPLPSGVFNQGTEVVNRSATLKRAGSRTGVPPLYN
jgi:hypothetical protein